MEALSVREYRNNLAASFTKADNGEQVLIRRKNEIYAALHRFRRAALGGSRRVLSRAAGCGQRKSAGQQKGCQSFHTCSFFPSLKFLFKTGTVPCFGLIMKEHSCFVVRKQECSLSWICKKGTAVPSDAQLMPQ